MKRVHPILLLPFATCANAQGTFTITEPGVLNAGSSLAYIALCERERHIESGTLADLMLDAQAGLDASSWNRLKTQYQKSLHEKKQYSVAYGKWYPFDINVNNCRELAKTAPLLRSTFARGKR